MRDLSADRIGRTTALIDPVFLHSPQFTDDQLCAKLGRRVVVRRPRSGTRPRTFH
jgi:threonine dehydratase